MRPIFFAIASLCLLLAACAHKAPRVDASSAAITVVNPPSSAPGVDLPADPPRVLASAASVYVPILAESPPPAENLPKVLAKMLAFLGLFSLGAYLLVRYLKGAAVKGIGLGLGLGLAKTRQNKLQVRETRMLGHKQFLCVVEYEGQKILLGTSPQGMQYLCKLDSQEPKSSEII